MTTLGIIFFSIGFAVAEFPSFSECYERIGGYIEVYGGRAGYCLDYEGSIDRFLRLHGGTKIEVTQL